LASSGHVIDDGTLKAWIDIDAYGNPVKRN
jgi:hypothetical protein